MMRALGEHFAETGYDVHVFSAMPPENATQTVRRREQMGKMSIRRCGMWQEAGAPGAVRALNATRYCLALFGQILWLRPTVVTAGSFPPVIAAATANLAARLVNARFIYHVQDIHPEVSEVIGAAMARGMARRFFLWLDNATLRNATQVVTLSRDMADTLQLRGCGIADLRVIENLALDEPSSCESPAPGMLKAAGRIRVIFAGNLGRFQNLPVLAEGVGQLFAKYPALELCFLGDGAVKAELKQKWDQHPQVQFLPRVSVSVARLLLADADIGLISLEPGMYRAAFPSKYQTYVSLGLPMVALVEPQSEMGQCIIALNQGAVARDFSASAVAEALESVLTRLPLQIGHDPEACRAAILASWSAAMADMVQD